MKLKFHWYALSLLYGGIGVILLVLSDTRDKFELTLLGGICIMIMAQLGNMSGFLE